MNHSPGGDKKFFTKTKKVQETLRKMAKDLHDIGVIGQQPLS